MTVSSQVLTWLVILLSVYITVQIFQARRSLLCSVRISGGCCATGGLGGHASHAPFARECDSDAGWGSPLLSELAPHGAHTSASKCIQMSIHHGLDFLLDP